MWILAVLNLRHTKSMLSYYPARNTSPNVSYCILHTYWCQLSKILSTHTIFYSFLVGAFLAEISLAVYYYYITKQPLPYIFHKRSIHTFANDEEFHTNDPTRWRYLEHFKRSRGANIRKIFVHLLPLRKSCQVFELCEKFQEIREFSHWALTVVNEV